MKEKKLTTEEMIGKKYGKLLIIERAENVNGIVHLKCVCDCGKECIKKRSNVACGHTRSCGCARSQALKNPLWWK